MLLEKCIMGYYSILLCRLGNPGDQKKKPIENQYVCHDSQCETRGKNHLR